MLSKDIETQFGTKDLYAILNVRKECSPAELKKAFHRKSLQYHPDRLSDADERTKQSATQKFQVLSSVYRVLADKDKRACYDESGVVDDDDVDLECASFEEAIVLWRRMFKTVTPEAIQKFIDEYKGSAEERADLKNVYAAWKGDLGKIMSSVMGTTYEDETRIKEMLDEMIKSGELESTPAYRRSTSKAAVARRQKKGAKEAAEAEEALKKLDASKSLEELILAKQGKRAEQMDSFYDSLAAKYAAPSKKKKTK